MEAKKIYKVMISDNPKVGFRLFKKIRATEQIAKKYANKLKAGFYVSLQEEKES